MQCLSGKFFGRAGATGSLLLAAVFGLAACSGGGGSGSLCDVPLEASLNSATRIGGASTSTRLFDVAGVEWTLYNVANELRARPVNADPAVPYHAIEVSAYIRDIQIVTNPADGVRYALLAIGNAGIAVINLTNPAAMQLVSSVRVNYLQNGVTWTEGGGSIVPDNTISSDRAPITALAVYDSDPADASNPLQLLIADEGYGLHKTLLSNLLGAGGPVLEADGTLLIDVDDNDPNTPPTTTSEVYTLQYAGEVPWGGPVGMTLYGSAPNQRLFVALGYLGMGIFDPDTLEQVGSYNLYTDAGMAEDWFIDMDVSAVVQTPPTVAACDLAVAGETANYTDDFTGMPNFRQACFEITEVWKGSFDCSAFTFDHECAPWAHFDRYGKDYYKARAIDVATYDVGGNPKTIAYIAYSLGGLVAVDVTGYATATPPVDPATNNWGNFLKASYLGYAPAVPANGPDTPTGTSANSLFPHFGSGMLKEAGAIAVKVKLNGPDGTATSGQVYYSDHFAGLVVMDGAENPAANWKDPSCPPAGCDNDTQGVLGDHFPDYEFVTSYDMTGADEHETLPAWMDDNTGPDLLATGEVSGHGNALALSTVMNTGAPGEIDVVLSAGAGGLNFLDIADLDPATIAANSFTLALHLATTDEIGADPDGLPLQDISIGHSEGVDAWRQYLFVADGPHGMSAWQIADASCNPIDAVHLVANTLQDEYDVVNTSGATVTPTPHAYEVVLDIVKEKALVLSQSLGLRRLGVADVKAGLGTPGAPLLLQPTVPDDIFEHNVEAGNVASFINRQDHAYDVVVRNNLAFVADGSNGITVYDLNVVPDYLTPTGAHVVSNLGAGSGEPLLGRATALELWHDPAGGRDYAFVAAGHAGIAVVDITDVENAAIAPENRMVLVKRFEPIKIEDGKVGHADGRSVDVVVVGNHAFFTYDSFGVVAYSIADLIAPLPAGVDPTDIWRKTPGKVDYRPVAVSRFKLQDDTLGGLASLSGWSGGALGMTTLKVGGRQLFYIGYGDAGVVKLNWTNPARPVLLQHLDTVGEALDVSVVNGRAYVADNLGGVALIR